MEHKDLKEFGLCGWDKYATLLGKALDIYFSSQRAYTLYVEMSCYAFQRDILI